MLLLSKFYLHQKDQTLLQYIPRIIHTTYFLLAAGIADMKNILLNVGRYLVINYVHKSEHNAFNPKTNFVLFLSPSNNNILMNHPTQSTHP